MRHRLALAVVGVLIISPAVGQQPAPITSLTAKDHVGETATVCGQVSEYSCRNSPFMTLTLAPATEPKPLTLRIADRGRLPNRLEDQFLGQIVCVRGRIEEVPEQFRVTVADPTEVYVQKQDQLKPPVRLNPSAHSACDPDVELPVVLRDARPRYTPAAMRERAQGAVMVRAVVEADGTVGEMQILRPLHPELDTEAARAVKQWRFRPGMYMGTPAAVIVTIEMTFTLRK